MLETRIDDKSGGTEAKDEGQEEKGERELEEGKKRKEEEESSLAADKLNFTDICGVSLSLFFLRLVI